MSVLNIYYSLAILFAGSIVYLYFWLSIKLKNKVRNWLLEKDNSFSLSVYFIFIVFKLIILWFLLYVIVDLLFGEILQISGLESVIKKGIDSSILIVLIINMYGLFTRWLQVREVTKLSKMYENPEKSPKMSYYNWLGKGIIQDQYIYNTFKQNISITDDLQILKRIRYKLIKKYGDDINDIHLLKSYLETHLKINFTDQASKLFLSIIIGLIPVAARVLLSSESISKSIERIIGDFYTVSTFTQISYLIDLATALIYVSSTLVFIINNLYQNKRRFGNIVAVLENIIYIKENEKSELDDEKKDTTN